MTRIEFARDAASLLRGASHLLVLAPAARLVAARKSPAATTGFARRLPAPLRDAIARLAIGLEPGDLGASSTTLVAGARETGRLTLAALPDRVSRHNCAARPESIRKLVAGAGLMKGGAILLVLDRRDHLLAAANAVHRGLPEFSRRSKKRVAGGAKEPVVRILAVGVEGEPLAPDVGERAVCENARAMATLVDTPPSELEPAAFARIARRTLRGLRGVKIREIVGAALLKERLFGIHTVGRAATVAPRVLIATYAPRSPTRQHVALVGKGITFDTGGLSIKTGNHMVGMKSDMAGAAAMLGAFAALVKKGCRHRLDLVLCLAENAIGPKSYKVDDILEMHSGKTVEINNTDAEGRLLLADGCSYAARRLGARIVLDAATLTGAQLIATGLLHAGIVATDEELEATLIAAGHASGDLCHPMLFAPEIFKQELKSPIADMRNSVKDRSNAPSSAAAQFVHWHVEDVERLRFGHIDLAGPAFPADRATGFGVALVYETVLRL